MNFSADPVHNIENLIAKNKTKSFSIYLVVILAVLGFLSLLPIIEVDISSQSRGMVRSSIDPAPLSPAVSGKVEFINLKNNALVQKGDTLLIVAQERLLTEKNILDTLQFTLQEQLQDIIALIDNKSNDLITSHYKSEFARYRSGWAELNSKVAQAQINYNRHKNLFDKAVIAKAEYEQYLYQLRFAREALTNYVASHRAQWQSTKVSLEERINTSQGSLQQLEVEQENYILTAPISGSIENYSGIQPGSFINPNQTIAIISSNDNLIVEATVLPNDIGLLKVGQEVQFQFDAFNYNQWGILHGKVIEIDNNATMQNDMVFFRVRCALNNTTLALKSGYETEISKGLTLTARFQITRRSLFDLLFDKVDDWLNPKTYIF